MKAWYDMAVQIVCKRVTVLCLLYIYVSRPNKRIHVTCLLDILVVDEASMIDLSMMYKLTEALPKSARLILLGDKDQLASVEAGAVLGDICSFSHQQFPQWHPTFKPLEPM